MGDSRSIRSVERQHRPAGGFPRLPQIPRAARQLDPWLLFLTVFLSLIGNQGVAEPRNRREVTYQSPDAYRVFAHHYLPDSAAVGTVVVFPDPKEGRPAWSALADSLRTRGLCVLVPELRGTGQSVFQRGIRRDRMRVSGSASSEDGLDAAGAMRYLRALPEGVVDPLVLIGSREAALAVQGSKDGSAAARILVSPALDRSESARVETTSGSPGKLLILTASGDIRGIESAATLIRMDREAECWIAEGSVQGAELLAAREDLFPDLLRWITQACRVR